MLMQELGAYWHFIPADSHRLDMKFEVFAESRLLPKQSIKSRRVCTACANIPRYQKVRVAAGYEPKQYSWKEPEARSIVS